MQYGVGQLSKIKSKVFAKIAHEFELATENDTIDEFLDKYEVVFEEECIPVNTRTMRIIVFGALAGNVKDYRSAAHKLGFEEDNIVFESDYDKLTNYDTDRLMDSFDFSDLIMTCNPHMLKNLDGYNNFTSKIKATPNRHPRLIESPDPHGQKLSISGFKACLLRTRYFENLN